MSPEQVVHWFMTLGVTAFAVVIWTIFNETRTKVTNLEKQNEKQERDIAGLEANHEGHSTTLGDLKDAIVRLEGKIDGLLARPSDRPHRARGK